ncbi:9722_t:CDS:1, partial [Cetraspora pellucida]
NSISFSRDWILSLNNSSSLTVPARVRYWRVCGEEDTTAGVGVSSSVCRID